MPVALKKLNMPYNVFNASSITLINMQPSYELKDVIRETCSYFFIFECFIYFILCLNREEGVDPGPAWMGGIEEEIAPGDEMETGWFELFGRKS